MKLHIGRILLVIVVFVFLIVLARAMHQTVSSMESFPKVQRCGVGLPSCSGKAVRCINGYCRSDAPSSYPLSDLPLTPSTRY